MSYLFSSKLLTFYLINTEESKTIKHTWVLRAKNLCWVTNKSRKFLILKPILSYSGALLNIDTLRTRLQNRKSESVESLAIRVKKAETEMKFESKFDTVLVNDKIEDALKQAEKITQSFLEK